MSSDGVLVRTKSDRADQGHGNDTGVVEKTFPPPRSRDRHKSRKYAAKKAGISQPTADKATKVLDVCSQMRESGKKQQAEQLEDLMEKSVSAAYRQVLGMLDADKKPVPESLKGIFQASVALRDAASKVAGAGRILKRLSEHPACHWMKPTELAQTLEMVDAAISSECPHAVCPKCIGKGCATCGKHGWLCRDAFKRVQDL